MSFNMVSMHERIHRRSGHIAVVYKNWLLVWGGYMERLFEGSLISEQEYHYTDELWSYNCDTELWDRIITKGEIPRLVCGSCGVLLNDDLYIFGGYYHDEASEGNTNELHRLDLKAMTWHLVNPDGQHPAACDKLAGWAYKNKVYFFGGFGPRPLFRADFMFLWNHFNNHGDQLRGWNNQLVVYDPKSNMWEWPRVKGTPPSPRAAHAADVSGDKAYIFGGRFLNKRMNDLYYLDMEQLCWSSNLTEEEGDVPEGRSWHSFTFVSPDRAVLYGGLSNTNTVLNNCWMLDVVRMCWWQDGCRGALPQRYWHTARFTATGELAAIGGARDHADEMVILDFAPKTLLRLCINVVLQSVPAALWMGAPNGVHSLPQSLEALLRRRFEQERKLPPLNS